MFTTCNKVFVYGTLKRGEGNHGYLLTSKFLGECRIPGILIDLGAFPAYIESKDPETTVFGQVFEMADEGVGQRLDGLEGYPLFYNRAVKPTPLGDAWVYFLPGGSEARERNRDIIENGEWSPQPNYWSR